MSSELDRLRALAEAAAFAAHTAAGGPSNGHRTATPGDWHFADCPHPDCVLVNLPAGVPADPHPIGPVPLTVEQEQTVREWAADDRLWTTQETVEINLRTFGRAMVELAGVPAAPPPSLKNRDTPENAAYWDHVERTAEDVRANQPAWEKDTAGMDNDSTPLTCDASNIAQLLTRRFGQGNPGEGLTLNCHEAHMLMAVLSRKAGVPAAPPPIRAHIEGCPNNLRVPVDLCDCGGRDFRPEPVPAAPLKACHDDAHEWTNQFGDDWTPESGTPCDCGTKRWGVPAAPPAGYEVVELFKCVRCGWMPKPRTGANALALMEAHAAHHRGARPRAADPLEADALMELIDACLGSVACDGSTAGACANTLKSQVQAALAAAQRDRDRFVAKYERAAHQLDLAVRDAEEGAAAGAPPLTADLATVREACRLHDKETGTNERGRSAVTAACDRIATERAEAQRTVAQLREAIEREIHARAGWEDNGCPCETCAVIRRLSAALRAVLAAGGAPSPQANDQSRGGSR